jgi:hypothetical protein
MPRLGPIRTPLPVRNPSGNSALSAPGALWNGVWLTLGLPKSDERHTHMLDEKEDPTMDDGFSDALDLVGWVRCAVGHRFTVLVERLATHAAGRERGRRAPTPRAT